MRWEKIRDEPAGATVVRALSFSTRTEDGAVVPVSTTVTRPRVAVRPQPSFTSIDVKKSRRVARRPTFALPDATPKLAVAKSCTLPNGANPSSMMPVETSTPLVPSSRAGQLRETTYKTQSLGRPPRVNKLVLRVPSAASEYQHKRVIHSQVEDVPDGSTAPPLVSQGCQTNLGGVPNINCDSSFCSKSQVPEKSHLNEFAQESPIYTISQHTRGDQWRTGTGAVSEVSASLSNLSSGDGLSSSTISRLSQHLSYDGLSTSTHMGSTTRLVPPKTTSKDRCNQCFGSEHISTTFAVLSFAGTIGNLLKLPRLVLFHGGGAFLLIYILVTLVFGIPLTFLEIGLGQFCQHGAVKLWRAVNLFRGVGYAKVFLSFILAISYSTQVASALAMLVYSVNEQSSYSDCIVLDQAKDNSTSLSPADECILNAVLAPASLQPSFFGVRLLFLIAIWTLVLICLMKRSSSYRKASYIVFPAFFVILIGLLVESSNQSDADVSNLFAIQWSAFGNIEVWYLSMAQVFFSVQVGFGNLNTCAGRIYPKSHAVWTAVCLVLSNLIIGIMCVILVYFWTPTTADYSAATPQTFVLLVMNKVSAISTNTTLWLCLVYGLVLIAGIASMMGLMYTVLVAAAVETKRRWRWRYINISLCIIGFVLSVACLVPGMLQVSEAVEYYGVTRGVMALTILELIALTGLYGCGNIYNDLEFVIGSKLCRAWKSMWILTPCVFLVLEITSAVLVPFRKADDELWELILGLAIYGIIWALVIICAIIQVSKQVDYNIQQKIASAVKPSRNWGPVDPIYRHCWVQWRNRYNLTGTKDFTLKRRGTRDYTHHARSGTPMKVDTLPWHTSMH